MCWYFWLPSFVLCRSVLFQREVVLERTVLQLNNNFRIVSYIPVYSCPAAKMHPRKCFLSLSVLTLLLFWIDIIIWLHRQLGLLKAFLAKGSPVNSPKIWFAHVIYAYSELLTDSVNVSRIYLIHMSAKSMSSFLSLQLLISWLKSYRSIERKHQKRKKRNKQTGKIEKCPVPLKGLSSCLGWSLEFAFKQILCLMTWAGDKPSWYMYLASLARQHWSSLEILSFYLCKTSINIPEGKAQI